MLVYYCFFFTNYRYRAYPIPMQCVLCWIGLCWVRQVVSGEFCTGFMLWFEDFRVIDYVTIVDLCFVCVIEGLLRFWEAWEQCCRSIVRLQLLDWSPISPLIQAAGVGFLKVRFIYFLCICEWRIGFESRGEMYFMIGTVWWMFSYLIWLI